MALDFSCGFQHAFTFKNVFKLYIRQYAHFLCTRNRVQSPLDRDRIETIGLP